MKILFIVLNNSMELFSQKIGGSLKKDPIRILQVNLGKKCNMACAHCHVDAGPHRNEELNKDALQDILALIERFDQIQSVDLTGGAPEMNNGFRDIVHTTRKYNKEVIDRSNLTIFFVPGFEDLPDFLADNEVKVVASLPCYIESNVDAMRGSGVFQKSIKALQKLNTLRYGSDEKLVLDLVYNPKLPRNDNFSLSPKQDILEKDYKKFLEEQFGVYFNSLITITNMPIGRMKQYLSRKKLYKPYLSFLAENYNEETIPGLMCKNQLSIDYEGNIYDCDFHQMEKVSSLSHKKTPLIVQDLLEENSLDCIPEIQLRNYCYGCTAGCGSSCSGVLI